MILIFRNRGGHQHAVLSSRVIPNNHGLWEVPVTPAIKESESSQHIFLNWSAGLAMYIGW